MEESIATIRHALDATNTRDFVALRTLFQPEFQRHDLAGALPEVSGTTGAADLI